MPISGHGWELNVQRLGVHVSESKRRTYGSYQVFQDGRALPGLSGFICECIGPGENTVPGTAKRIAQGTYPLSTQFGRYRTVGYSDDTSTAGRPPMPAILVEQTINRSGILIHPGHPPNLFLSSIGCFNPTSALLSWQEIDFWDSRSRVIALIDDLHRFALDAFRSIENTMIPNASIVVDGEPMNILVSPDEVPVLAGAAMAQPLAVAPVFRPVAIDLYQGDNVQDTPGPLGGFARVKADGIAFLLHKATQGVTSVDSRYQARRAAWMSGGPISVTDIDGKALQLAPRFAAYHFLTLADPVAQAQHFLATAKLKPGDDAAVDWEATKDNPAPSADAVDAFCSEVEKTLGFPIIVYSGNVAKEQLKGVDARFAKRRLWLAEYNDTFTVQKTWAFPWLWQDNGDSNGEPAGPGPNNIPGIDGICDNSTIAGRMTVAQLYAEWGGGQQPAVQQEPSARESILAEATRTKMPGPNWPNFRGQAVLVGASPSGRVTIYVDKALGQAGMQNAKDLLIDADRVVQANDHFFATSSGSANVIIYALGGKTDGTGGADHNGCDYVIGNNIEVCASFGNSARVSGLFEAELSECNMSGKLCGVSTGEALSRWCAASVCNNALSDFATAPGWFDDGAPDFVTRTDPTDRNPDSTGCGMAFISWLLSQNIALATIAQGLVPLGANGTFAQLYGNLTGKDPATAWQVFMDAVRGLRGGISGDDPFGGMPTVESALAIQSRSHRLQPPVRAPGASPQVAQQKLDEAKSNAADAAVNLRVAEVASPRLTAPL